MSSLPARHALFGQPVAQSLSPAIHAAFGRQTGVQVAYTAVDVEAEGLAAALAGFAAAGGRGANVTLPHKQRAAVLCATLSERARRAGAVNTLVRQGDLWHGDNTDGAGLVRDLTDRQGIDLRQRRTLLLGAGGAARGIAPALLDAGIGALFVVNRSPERADALVDALGEPRRVHARYFQDLRAMGEFDLVVNATSAARNAGLPTLPMSLLGNRSTAVDLSYGEAAVPFLSWARAGGAHDVIDGLGMLVEQAAESFRVWHGMRPDTDDIHDQLRARSAVLATAD